MAVSPSASGESLRVRKVVTSPSHSERLPIASLGGRMGAQARPLQRQMHRSSYAIRNSPLLHPAGNLRRQRQRVRKQLDRLVISQHGRVHADELVLCARLHSSVSKPACVCGMALCSTARHGVDNWQPSTPPNCGAYGQCRDQAGAERVRSGDKDMHNRKQPHLKHAKGSAGRK